MNNPTENDGTISGSAEPHAEPLPGSEAESSSDSKVKAKPEKKPIEEQTLLEQMGGWQGLVSTTLPILVLVPVNSKWGLGPALIAALSVALLILVWRVIRKETIQPAISGFLGVAFAQQLLGSLAMPKAISLWYLGIFGLCRGGISNGVVQIPR